MFKNISIVGVGNLTKSLLYRIKSTPLKVNINLYDLDKKKKSLASQKSWQFYTIINNSLNASDLIIIAVKPNQYKDVCNKIAKHINKNAIIVSLMAGIKVKDIKREFSNSPEIARVMTNINAKYGKAISSVYLGQGFKRNKVISLKSFFSLFGSIKMLKTEVQIDKATALIGSGPAYFIYFAESIFKTFQSFGFSKNESKNLVTDLFYGTALTCKEDKRDFEEIKKSIVSKGGTTESALKRLDRLQTKKIIMGSIKDAYIKAKSLGKNK